MHGMVAALLVLGLSGCGREPSSSPGESADVAETTSTAAAPTKGFQDYSVEVKLSPAAQARLAKGKETIVISADYFGQPIPAAASQAKLGQLELGHSQQEMSGAGTARFIGTGFLSDKLASISGDPLVNINVFSGRKSSPDNFLHCDFFQDTLAAAAKTPVVLHCKLIDEPSSSTR
ncbi:hypothetical protein CSC73_11430 [Pseudoxanthomonas sacheonensis]|nr:hypothetical protein CSC73_11430 [Pseudoxanthomonas sacheonensis]